MPRMAVYVYSDEQIRHLVNDARRNRVRLCVISGLIIAAVIPLMVFFPFTRLPARDWLVPIFIGLLAPVFQEIWNWRTWPERFKNSLNKTRIELSTGGIRVSSAFAGDKTLGMHEIMRAEEPSTRVGLYLRTSNRYRWIVIPANLDGFETIKHELRGAGIEVKRTSIPPNWEEYLGALLFIATMICAVVVNNIRFLTINIVIALLLSLSGLAIINSNPDNFPRMRWLRFGAFIPVIFAAIALWSALGGWR